MRLMCFRGEIVLGAQQKKKELYSALTEEGLTKGHNVIFLLFNLCFFILVNLNYVSPSPLSLFCSLSAASFGNFS